jgi:hypothetical protein
VEREAQGAVGDAASPIEREGRVDYDGCAPCTASSQRRDNAMSDEKNLQVGDPAPDFTLKTIGLKEISLKDYDGKNIVLLFYPLDWTPG